MIVLNTKHILCRIFWYFCAVREVPSVTGNWISLLFGGIIAVFVSLLSGRSKEGPEVWEKTRDIDSPLSPWTELYEK